MGDNIFLKIIAKQIPAKIVYEDDRALAFHDIGPKAPVHILVIPKKEIANLGQAGPGDETVLGHLLLVAEKVAKEQGVAETGYRLVINNGAHAGQAVPHLHVHILGGRQLKWPPG
jgi:histidine triad (HIT) family protein